MKRVFLTRIQRVASLFLAALVCLSLFVFGGGRYALNSVSANAASGDLIEIQAYDLHMVVREDRSIEVQEKITVEFLASGLTMFYRSLPTDGARYRDIVATCEGNDAFHYYVEDNPDESGFFDINCVGNAGKGNVWTYEISYLMEQGVNTHENGMIIDVVGFGWTVPLHNVQVRVDFPAAVETYKVHTDIFGSVTENQVTETLSADRKSITMYADILMRGYSEKYDEYVTGGVTLEFSLPKGALKSYAASSIFTRDMWKILLGAVFVLAAAFAVLTFTKTKRELITVVNIKAPDKMDPMKMGKWLDGSIDDEDVTSMIYYFANKGYLKIDLTDENDPTLIKCVGCLADSAPTYEKTLFNGLFYGGKQSVRVSEAVGKFYDSIQEAKLQTPNPPTMYETKSVWGYIGGGLLGVALAALTCFLMGTRLGGGYQYFVGFAFAIPILIIGVMGYIAENYRYKWKAGKKRAMRIGQIAIAILFSLIFTFFFANHIMAAFEKIVLCMGVFGACFITQSALSRTEEYSETLSHILGFKDFIVVTEEDKIKFMLEENPELYYKVLPYAQVLGVTDEWEEKFKSLTIAPPSWCYSSGYTYNHYFIHRSLNRAMAREIAAEVARRSNSGGGKVGRSGGGGSFGSFGGGGFGGGGGGAR